MITQQTLQNYIAKLIEFGATVLGSTEYGISTLFSGYERFLNTYSSENINENILEIQLEGATLSCFLGESGKCELSILFLDNISAVKQYINYFDAVYPYNSTKEAWKTPYSYLRIVSSGGDLSLVQNVSE